MTAGVCVPSGLDSNIKAVTPRYRRRLGMGEAAMIWRRTTRLKKLWRHYLLMPVREIEFQ